MNAYLAKFMTYFQIKSMQQQGHSLSAISRHLSVDRRTIKKYLSMSEQEYETFLDSQSHRSKILLSYEGFVKNRLEQYRDTSAAQMHDWLKEYHADFPEVSQKTVFNFVSWIRKKHRLPVVKEHRQHQMVEETPYGHQAQVDFGVYNMRSSLGHRVKVFFFTFLLSRSRFKYVPVGPTGSPTDLLLQRLPFWLMKRLFPSSMVSPMRSFTTRTRFSSLVRTTEISF